MVKPPINTQTSSELGYFSRFKLSLFSPSELFEEVKEEKDLWHALKFFCITNTLFILPIVVGLALIFYFVLLLSSSLLGMLFPPALFQSLYFYLFLFLAIFFVVSLAFSVLLSFLSAGIFHLFAKLFRGTGSYFDTYKVIAYSQTPLLLIGFQFLIGFLFFVLPQYLAGVLQLLLLLSASVWQIVIIVNGVSILHEMSKGKVFVVWLCLALVFLLLYILAFFALMNYSDQQVAEYMLYQNMMRPNMFDSSGSVSEDYVYPSSDSYDFPVSRTKRECTKTKRWCYNTVDQTDSPTPWCYDTKDECAQWSSSYQGPEKVEACYAKDWWCDSDGGCAEREEYC